MQASQISMQATVVAVTQRTPTIREFTLEPEQAIGPCPPGSHVVIDVDIEGHRTQRSYSVVQRRPDGRLTIAVKDVGIGRGGARWMHGLIAGSRVRMSSPRNNFPLSSNGRSYLLVAGGIGVTPLVSMNAALRRRGCDVRFIYGARSDDELAFQEELRSELGASLATFVEDRGERFDLRDEFRRLAADTEAYICGPYGLLDAAQSVWRTLGRDPSKLRIETFGAGMGAQPRPFVVRLAAFDREIPVAANQTMLEAMIEADIPVMSGCRKGECGLCVLDVVETETPLEHADVFLSRAQHEEGHIICACVSRVTGGRITVRAPYRPDAPFELDARRGLTWNGVPTGF